MIEASAWTVPLVLAPFVGSFLAVLILRLPTGRPVVLARSVCEHCGTRLGVRDLVPLASYLIQRGRCRFCSAVIDPTHLAVELAAIAILLPAALIESDPARLWLDCLLGWTLLTLSWIDWQWMRLPDVLTLPLLLAGLGATWLCQPEELTEHAAAAMIAYLSMQGLALAYRRLRGRDGLGAGDAKLLAAAGAWLGLAPLPWLVLLAASTGLVTALCMALAGQRLDRYSALPFGPFLSLALWLCFLCRGD
jgi:leader peptidase (prepilin peptidase)/N-methyltransferase